MNLKPFAAGAAGAALVMGLAMSNDVRAVAAALVNVTNTSVNPVAVRSTDLLNGWGTRVFPSPSRSDSFVVPADKRLVITSVTGFNNSGLGTDTEMIVVTNGVGTATRYPYHRPGPGLSYLENVNTLVVADAGSRVSFFTNSTSASDTGGYNVDVKGYYIPN